MPATTTRHLLACHGPGRLAMSPDDGKRELASVCRLAIDVPFGVDESVLVRELWERGWLLTLRTPPGKKPVLLGALCFECARATFPAAAFVQVVAVMRSKFGKPTVSAQLSADVFTEDPVPTVGLAIGAFGAEVAEFVEANWHRYDTAKSLADAIRYRFGESS